MSLWKNTTGKELNFNVGKRAFVVKEGEAIRLDNTYDYVIGAKGLPLVKADDDGKQKIVSALAPPALKPPMPGVSSGGRSVSEEDDEDEDDASGVVEQLRAQAPKRK